MLKMSAFLPFTVANYIFNSVVNTKLPAILSHRCSTTVSLETYPFIHPNESITKSKSFISTGWTFDIKSKLCNISQHLENFAILFQAYWLYL